MSIFEPVIINFDFLRFPMDERITEDHIRKVLRDPFKKFMADPIPGEVGTSYYVQGWAFPLEGMRQIPYGLYFSTDQITLLNVSFIDAGDRGEEAYIRFVQEASEEEYRAYVQGE